MREKKKLHDSELKIMAILWERGTVTAKELSEILSNKVGWNKTTTYTIIRRCIQKGYISKSEPNYICEPLVSREDAQDYETDALLEKLFSGLSIQLVASLLSNRKMSKDDIQKLRTMLEEMEDN